MSKEEFDPRMLLDIMELWIIEYEGTKYGLQGFGSQYERLGKPDPDRVKIGDTVLEVEWTYEPHTHTAINIKPATDGFERAVETYKVPNRTN